MLRELQQQFLASLFGDTEPQFAPHARLTASMQAEIYANNHYYGLLNQLAGVFPVCHRLLSEANFSSLAQGYIRQHGAADWDISLYGHAFADYLAQQAEFKAFDYLSDLARLEWFIYKITVCAPLAGPLDLPALSAVISDPTLCLHPPPGSEFLYSMHPIVEIWQRYQTTPPSDIALSRQASYLFLYREGDEVAMVKLPDAEWHFLRALNQGQPVNEAAAGLDKLVDELDFTAILPKYLRNRWITDFSLRQDNA